MARVSTGTRKNVNDGAKRVAVEFWRTKVPLSTIRAQLKLSESTMRRILAFAKRNRINPIIPRKPGSGRPKKISEKSRRLTKKKLQAKPKQPHCCQAEKSDTPKYKLFKPFMSFFPHIYVRPVRFFRVYCIILY
jgi:hypothetical protein